MADDRPRASLRPAVAWVAAAVAAVAVASWGVALVGRSVTDERPSPLSASQVEQRLQDLATTTTRAAVTTTETSTTTTEPVSDPAITTTTTTAAPPTTAPPPPTTATGETRTYSMVGGTASLRFAPTGVTVVFANPAPGFDVEVEPEHGGVKVEFESEDHRSRLEGWWEDGPQDRVEEGDHDD